MINEKVEYPTSFIVTRRNFGHWDITIPEYGRAFRIRGGPGKYKVWDERDEQTRKDEMIFLTVGACMSYLCDLLMFELIIVDGQHPAVIEGWNI